MAGRGSVFDNGGYIGVKATYGVSLGANIVTTGLVQHLNAGNPSSYPGSGTTWTDLSGNGKNGTLLNGVGYGSTAGGTLTFDGTDDCVSCGDIIKGRTEFSAEAWIRTSDTRTGSNSTYMNPTIFGTQHGSGYSGDFAVVMKAGKLGAYWENTGTAGYIDLSSVTVADNTWRQIVATKSTGGNISFYVNGSSVYSVTDANYTFTVRTGDLTNFNWELGRAYWYGEDGSMLRFAGSIASHLFYSIALTPAQVLQNFNAQRSRFGV